MYIIACPSCQTKFKLKPEMVGTGKNMTCAKCKHKWFFAPPTTAEPAPTPAESPPAPAPTEEAPPSAEEIQAAIAKLAAEQGGIAPPPPAEEEPLAAPAAPITASHQNHGAAFWRGIGLYAAFIAVVCGLGITKRAEIAGYWPPAARIYDVIGVPVPVLGAGLAIGQLTWDVVRQEKLDETTGEKIILPIDTISVSGHVTNRTEQPLVIPQLVAKTMSAQNEVLNQTTLHADGEKILPGETIPFHAELPLQRNVDFKIMVTFAQSIEPAAKAESATANEPATEAAPTESPQEHH